MHSTALPVLLLDESRLQQIDTQNHADLYLMWSVFHKAAQVMEDGKRLENLSWRLWNAQTQTLYCKRTPPQLFHSRTSTHSSQRSAPVTESSEVPTLSSSVSSASSAGAASEDESLASLPAHRLGQRNKSLDLETLVHSIKAKQELKRPISPLPLYTHDEPSLPPSRTASNRTPRPSSPRPVETKSSTSTVATTAGSYESSAVASSQTSAVSTGSDHSVVRGFAPGSRSSYTCKSQLVAPPPQPTPILKSSASKAAMAEMAANKKKAGMFMLGSGSSNEDESSLKSHMLQRAGRVGSIATSDESPKSTKKQTSFNERVEICSTKSANVQDNKVFDDTDDEDEDDPSESAIEDDDDAWEDDASSESAEEPKPMVFQRVDSARNVQLPSRKSQLALALEQQKRSSTDLPRSPALRRSRTSTPNGPSMPASPTDESVLEATMGKPIRAPATAQVPTPTLSPRTTRRNMLAGELSESFRKQMIHERSQRQIYTNGPKRAHTSVDLRDPARQKDHNRFFESGDYHTKGW